MKNQKSNWKTYIKELPNFPPLVRKWEHDFIQILSENIPKNKIKTVLEVGCSNGRWLRWFNQEYNCKVYGVDNDSTGFKEGDIIDFTLGDARNLPYKNEFFDLVFSMGLIEHFLKKEKHQILKEQYRVLKEDGFLICQIPRLDFHLNFLYMKYAYDYKKGAKHYMTTQGELEKYFKNLGLEIILSGFTGVILDPHFKNFFESSLFKRISKFKFFRKLFGSEMLIIGKK